MDPCRTARPYRRPSPSRFAKSLSIPFKAAGSSSTVPSNLPPLRFTDEQLQDLRRNIDLLTQVAQSLTTDPLTVLYIKSSFVDGINFLEKILKEGQVADAPSLGSCTPPQNERPILFETESSSSIIDEAETTTKMRHLYVSTGDEIYLLDLKKTSEKPLSNAGDSAPLPIIATANLIEKKLPVSVSLFKRGSDAFIIGGQKHNANSTLQGRSKATSLDSFRLSFAEGKNTLSFINGVIGKMKCPKTSPIVEEINGAIHVFGSTPRGSYEWQFSHEILEELAKEHQEEFGRCRLQWREISKLGSAVENFKVKSHLVVGPRIYARSGPRDIFFDSSKEEKQWEALTSKEEEEQYRARGRGCRLNEYTVRTACDILRLGGTARCVHVLGSDKIQQADSQMYYVIIAVTWKPDPIHEGDEATVATAFLVNSLGKVVCWQPLPQFFEEGPMQPFGMYSGTIIRVDAEGKVMCSLVAASTKGTDEDCLFINTFTVKELTSSQFEIGKRNPKRGEFIRVDIKHRYRYKKEDRLLNSLQACFV